MSKTKTTKSTKRAIKLKLGDVIEFANVKYRIKRLVHLETNNRVSITAIDVDTPANLCYKHREENEVLIVLNMDRRIPVLK